MTVNGGVLLSVNSGVKQWPVGTVNLNGGTKTAISLESEGGTFNVNAGTLNASSAAHHVAASRRHGDIERGFAQAQFYRFSWSQWKNWTSFCHKSELGRSKMSLAMPHTKVPQSLGLNDITP